MPAGKGIDGLAHDEKTADARSQILKALGNPVRLRIAAFVCAAGERSVGEICDGLGLPQSTVSQQLASLRLHGLLQVRSEGGHRYYSVAMPEVRDLMDCLARCRRVHAGD
jgi:DNA-binding transcriptional ArsR family regulator